MFDSRRSLTPGSLYYTTRSPGIKQPSHLRGPPRAFPFVLRRPFPRLSEIFTRKVHFYFLTEEKGSLRGWVPNKYRRFTQISLLLAQALLQWSLISHRPLNSRITDSIENNPIWSPEYVVVIILWDFHIFCLLPRMSTITVFLPHPRFKGRMGFQWNSTKMVA